MMKKSGVKVKEKAKKPVRARASKKAPPEPKKRAAKKVPAKSRDQKSLELLLGGVVDGEEHNLGEATFVKVMEGNECAVKFLGGPFNHSLSGVPAGTTVPVNILKNPMFVLRKCVKPEVYLAKAALYKYFRSYISGNGQAPKSATATRDIATLVAEAVKRQEETPAVKVVPVVAPSVVTAVPVLVSSVPARPEMKNRAVVDFGGSEDIGALKTGVRGRYVIGSPGARALILVRGKYGCDGSFCDLLVVEKWSSLYGKCRERTFVPHWWLTKGAPGEIYGDRANDMRELLGYLKSVICVHKKKQAQAAHSSFAEKPGSFDPHKGNGRGNFLRIPEPRTSQQAALLSPKPAGEGEPVH